MKRSTFTMIAAAAIGASLATAPAALAGQHTWRITELFSTADGSVQFIELWESMGTPGETFVNGLQVTSEETGNAFTFPANLASPTTNRRILLATQSFADLPGAPTPDHIIPQNFFDPVFDTIRYHVYDTWAIINSQVPTDCVNSLHRNFSGPHTVAPNSPTNYAGQTGQVDACPKPACPADIAGGGDGSVGVADLLAVISAWGPCPTPPPDCAADIAPNGGDGAVGVADLLTVISAWGPCP